MADMTPELVEYEKSCRAEEALKLACEEIQDLAQCCPATQYSWKNCRGSSCEENPVQCWADYFKGQV